MDVKTEDVKKLREATGISIMQCKKALEEASGNLDQAMVILQKKSGAAAAKKSDRSLGAGTVASYIHGEGSVGAMVELASETDFVSKNDEFKALAREIAMHVAAMNPQFLTSEDITENDKNTALEVFKKEVADKPAEMQEKIIEGKMNSYFKDKVLLNQSYIKDADKTIDDLVKEAVQKFGENIQVVRYSRFAIGS